jgi:hypothetical protein
MLPPHAGRSIAIATIGVLAFASAAPSAPPSSRTTGGFDGYRIVRAPIAVYGREAGQPFYIVYLRLNRAVPSNPGNSPAATVRLGGLGLSQAPGPGESSMGFLRAPSGAGRHCYEQQLPLSQPGTYPPEMNTPRVGRKLKVEVFIRGVRSALVTEIRLRRRALPQHGGREYLRELHCAAG